jgi:hypothetical protein
VNAGAPAPKEFSFKEIRFNTLAGGEMRKLGPGLLLLLYSILLSFLVYGCGGTSKSIEQCPMRFAVIGDRTGEAQPGVYEQILAEIQRLRPDFAVTVGDMIEGPAPDTVEIKRRWDEYQGLIQKVCFPIYFTPGNNDIWDSTSQAFYERYVGQPYRSFDVRGVHFVVLDNSRWFTINDFPPEQLNWLADDLKENQNAPFTIVLYHVPYWMDGVAEGKPDTLHSLFVKYGVDAVFSGHWHHYFSGKYDGILYTGIGSSGGHTYHPVGPKYHFAWVTIDGAGITIAPVKMGAVLPWDEVTAAQVKLIDKIQEQAVNMQRPSVGTGLTLPPTRISVTIDNMDAQTSLIDTLTWEVPAGWSVIPADLPIDIQPSESRTVEFQVRSSGRLYPGPTLSVSCPYGDGKEYEVKQTLTPSRTVYAYHAQEPPSIDGRLTESIWKDPASKLFAEDGSAARTEPVNFYFAWDTDNLYLAARCTETKMDSIVAISTEHDGPIYGEDCVGYFLQPQTDDGPMYMIYFNPLGTAFDQEVRIENGVAVDADRNWNGTYDVKTFEGNDYWSIEARIPLDRLDTKGESGETWQLNFRRKQKRLNAAADWIVPLDYDPKGYGLLVMK